MKDEDRESLRAILEQSESALAKTKEEPADRADRRMDKCALDRLARMDLLQAQRIAEEAEQRHLSKLRQVREALQRIDSEGYGLCAACGEAIDLRRLTVDPTFRRCLECAALP